MLLCVISPSVNFVDSSLVRGSLYLCKLLNAVLQADFVITLADEAVDAFAVKDKRLSARKAFYLFTSVRAYISCLARYPPG